MPNLSKDDVVVDMFCRLLNSLDDGLVSLDYLRTAEETTDVTQVKDAMSGAWYDIVSLFRNSYPEICANILGYHEEIYLESKFELSVPAVVCRSHRGNKSYKKPSNEWISSWLLI